MSRDSGNPTMQQRLLFRELHGNSKIASNPNIYGSKKWVEDLDIIGELRGHDGCINALQWSRDGSLLATGSDDHRINIYKANAGFSLNTQIETGHRGNIFSVKFMPFSSDRTIISAAGDSQIRVFDIEYAPTTYSSLSKPPLRSPDLPSRPARTRRIPGGPRLEHPTPGRVHAQTHRVYKSHTNATKRIVTESSPHLFLTCSEDGTVRQFDLRQESSFYTRPNADAYHRPTFFGALRAAAEEEDEDERNPPLISYRRHGIELFTLSCSQSQPHYLALGGGHVHCFLHDRRMLGRDRLREAGQRARPGAGDDDTKLSDATQCVKRFGPPMGKSRKRKMQSAHITACKISDANPNEVVASWSGDAVYLFDINRSPAPNESGLGREPWDPEEASPPSNRAKQSTVGKKAGSKKRRRSTTSLSSTGSADEILPGQRMKRIPGLVIDMRHELFGLGSSNLQVPQAQLAEEKKKSWDQALKVAHVALRRINRSIDKLDQRDLDYFETVTAILDPDGAQERRRRALLAKARRRTRTFVMAGGCLARALGGHVDGIGIGAGTFAAVTTTEAITASRYRFLNVIISFLDSGIDGIKALAHEHHLEEAELLEETVAGEIVRRIRTVAGEIAEFFDDLALGAHESILRDVDTSDQIFDSELAMVTAFRRMVERCLPTGDPGNNEIGKRFWGEKVARALLMKEAEGINHEYVCKAFQSQEVLREEEGRTQSPEAGPSQRRRVQGVERTDTQDENGDDEDHVVDVDMSGVDAEGDEDHDHEHDEQDEHGEHEHDEHDEHNEHDEHDENDEHDEHDENDENDEHDEHDEEEEEEEDDDDDDDPRMFLGDLLGIGGSGSDDEDEDEGWGHHPGNYDLEPQAPVQEHIKAYRGHCNVRTVKDVNFYGLNDEYIVSGSDCGNLFIWDKKTTNLVQILHGDDDTVNVAVGHPSEPLIAVSGIDYTVKLFSPDREMQYEFGANASEANKTGNPSQAAYSGPASRRKMHEKQKITNQNEIMSENRYSDAVFTREMLAQLITSLRAGDLRAL